MSLRIGPTTVIGPASQEITHADSNGVSHGRVSGSLNAVRVTGINMKSLGDSTALAFAGDTGKRIKPIRITLHIAGTNGVVAGDGTVDIGTTPAGTDVMSGMPVVVTDAAPFGKRGLAGVGALPPMPADTTVWYITVAAVDTGAATVCLVDLEVQYEQF